VKLHTKEKDPLRLALAGVSHDHIDIIDQLTPADFIIVGACDPDPDLVAAFGTTWGISASSLYGELDQMLVQTAPDVVAAFGPISDHLAVVRACAPRGIHVMVEKPFAISPDHARQMAELARRHSVHVLTNYETSWYPSTFFAIDKAAEVRAFGAIRKVLVRDGHGGPVETGCRAAFLSWLMDPAQSGGGALTDFGCYGANLMTRLMGGRHPRSVMAQTHCFKPGIYDVEDDALIVLDYGDAEAVIQASWNWPFSRKDMEIYGANGFVAALDKHTVELARVSSQSLQRVVLPELRKPLHNPFAYLDGVLRGSVNLDSLDLASIENNLVVTDILAAAQRSAAEGRTIFL
jgi:predicted dehydrogenase